MEALRIVLSALSSSWWAVALVALLAAGWYIDRSSLSGDLHLLTDQLDAKCRRVDELTALLEQSQTAVTALQEQLAEADAALAASRKAAQERAAIVKEAKTRKAKSGEVLDESSSARVLRHMRQSLGSLRSK
jgi:hypothetical protein